MKRSLIFVLAALFSLFAIAGYAQDKAAVSKQDMKFVSEAASGNMLEVELGKYVSQQGSADEVKKFAERMVTDHSKANEDLMSIAQKKNITMPNQMSKKHMRTVERLKKLQGAELDRAYMKEMVKDHKEDVKKYRRAAEKLKDPELKSYAASTLTVLQEHQKLAQEIAGKMKK